MPRLGSFTAWAVVVYQGVLGAVAHIWWYRAVQVVGPSQAAIFTNLQPIVGIVLAPLLVGERIGLWQILGTACVLAGVGLTTARLSPRPLRRRQGPALARSKADSASDAEQKGRNRDGVRLRAF